MLSEVLALYLELDELELIRDALEYTKGDPYGNHKPKVALAKLAHLISCPPDELLKVFIERKLEKLGAPYLADEPLFSLFDQLSNKDA